MPPERTAYYSPHDLIPVPSTSACFASEPARAVVESHAVAPSHQLQDSTTHLRPDIAARGQSRRRRKRLQVAEEEEAFLRRRRLVFVVVVVDVGVGARVNSNVSNLGSLESSR